MPDFVKSLAQSAAQIDKVAAGSLYPHQSDGVAFLLSKRRVTLADDKGLENTRQTNVTPVISACMKKSLWVSRWSLNNVAGSVGSGSTGFLNAKLHPLNKRNLPWARLSR